jgi:glycosyltransferase involved in cell wall biosynthesis
MDPDLYVFRRMTEVDDLLDGAVNGVVTPHALQSVRSSPVSPGDGIFLKCGIFNLGFLALKKTDETLRMVAWWKEKLKWECIVDWRNGYFVDQKWLEFLPIYFDGFHILKLPTYNLAPWNSEHYKILADASGNFFINDFDTPVAFIHYSGVKRSEHHFGDMKEAYAFYLGELQKRRFMKLDFVNYELRFKQDNLYMDKVCTFLYKDYVKNTKDVTSNPLADGDFYAYLHSVDDQTKLPLYIKKLYEMLPDIFVGYLQANLPITYDNLIGLIKNYFPYDGVVSLETMTQLRNDSIGVHGAVDRDICAANDEVALSATAKASYRTAIFSFCGDAAQQASQDTTSNRQVIFKSDRVEIIDGAVRICMPHIDEAGALPDSFDIEAKNYAEIWVPSDYCKRKLNEAYGLTNVAAIPYPVLKPKYEIRETALPNNKFTVILRHDFNLDFAMQNPMASLEAFKKAFGQRDDVMLVGFLTNVKRSENYDRLVAAFADEKNTRVIEGAPDDALYYSCLHRAHCFISLHQKTVFGYRLAEAMSLGKYVVATEGGGNTDYMNADNSFLIDSAAADSAHEAANILTTIYDDKNVLSTKSKRAKFSIQKQLSPNSVGFIMQKQIANLHKLQAVNLADNKSSFLFRVIRKLIFVLKVRIRHSRMVVRLYEKIQRDGGMCTPLERQTQEQVATLVTILLKNVSRPEILE